MARVLVIDDSAADRLLVMEILAVSGDLECEAVDRGSTALERIAVDPPDLVLTDLVMPGMDGFEVVAALRERHPGIPIILMTSQGNEEIAVRALREGASSYVPKRNLATDLPDTVHEILGLAGRRRVEERILEALETCDLSFRLSNRSELVLPLVRHLQELVVRMGICDEAEVTQVGVALAEALGNAIEHGNLEIEGALRDEDVSAHGELVAERRRRRPWCDRCVRVEAHLTPAAARFVVRDEGSGFDPGTLPDPRDPSNLGRAHGRGVLLMRSFMDEVTWNAAGNEVTMTKRRPSFGTEAGSEPNDSPA